MGNMVVSILRYGFILRLVQSCPTIYKAGYSRLPADPEKLTVLDTEVQQMALKEAIEIAPERVLFAPVSGPQAGRQDVAYYRPQGSEPTDLQDGGPRISKRKYSFLSASIFTVLNGVK